MAVLLLSLARQNGILDNVSKCERNRVITCLYMCMSVCICTCPPLVIVYEAEFSGHIGHVPHFTFPPQSSQICPQSTPTLYIVYTYNYGVHVGSVEYSASTIHNVLTCLHHHLYQWPPCAPAPGP